MSELFCQTDQDPPPPPPPPADENSWIRTSVPCFPTVNIQKRMLYCHISSFQAHAVPINFIKMSAEMSILTDPGVASSSPARSHTFVEIDHEIISTVIFLLPLIYSRRAVVSYKRKYVHELLVNRLFKPAQEIVWLSELTVPQ